MKASLIVAAFALSGLFGSMAQAQTPGEVVNLGVYFGVYNCTVSVVNNNTTTDCTQTPGGFQQNVPVTMNDCNSDTTGDITCEGSWTNNITVNNTTYSAEITVLKSIVASGQQVYSAFMMISDSTSNQMNSSFLNFASTVPTDTASVSSAYVQTDSNGSGTASSLSVGPANLSNMRVPKVIRVQVPKKK